MGTRQSDVPVDRSATPGYIDDRSVHAEIYTKGEGHGVINFLVDPESSGTHAKAITDKSVNEFYPNGSNSLVDDENMNYRDTSEYGESGLIFYRLSYANGFHIEQSDRTWVIMPNAGEAKLSVNKYRSAKSQGASRTIYLATYAAVPFELTVSLDSLTDRNLAPRKYQALSTTWGEIKER